MKKQILKLLLFFTVLGYSQTNPTSFSKIKVTAATKKNDATRVIVQDSLTKEYHWQVKSNFVQNALGYTPENVANKSTNFTTINNTLYPSVQAVKNYADNLTKGWYVSSINGNDSNLGNSEKSPFLTITKALSVVNDGENISLEAGTSYNETYVVTKNRTTLQSYGVGKKPIVTGANAIATPTLVSGNVWTTTNSFGFGINAGRPVLFENGIALQPVANTSECQALPGSYIVSSGDSFAAGNYTTQFHPYDSGNPTSNGRIYTANTRATMIASTGVNAIKVEGVEMSYSWIETVLALNTPNSYVKNSTAKWGNKHNIFIGDNSTAENVVAYGAEMQGQYGRTATMFVAYSTSPVANSAYSFIDCQAINDYKKVGQKQGLGLIGFLNHTGTSSFKTGNYTGCYGRGLDNSIASNSEFTYIKNCYFEGLTGKVIGNNSMYVNIDGSFFQGLKLTDNTTLSNSNIYTNSAFIKLKVSAPSIGSLDFNNCLFFNEIKIGTTAVENINFIDQTALPISYTSFGCVYFNYNIMLVATSGAYAGDYNIFTTSSANQIRNVLSGTQYTTLSTWQTATGQDSNSVYLTQAQQLTFFLQDPNTGNIVVNPQASVTAANGTIYVGTFPDGTLISSKFTNKMFSLNRAVVGANIIPIPSTANSNAVLLTGNQSISGVKTFVSSPIVPNATTSTQAVNKSQLDLKSDLVSPEFTGTPTAPTATLGTNTTQIATTAFVQSAATSNIAQTITNGVTTSAPSQDAVFDALVGKQAVLGYIPENSFYKNVFGGYVGLGVSGEITSSSYIATGGTVRLKNYTVATLPTGVQGDTAYVTDALTPTYLGILVGGGAVVTPVFYNGTTWVSH